MKKLICFIQSIRKVSLFTFFRLVQKGEKLICFIQSIRKGLIEKKRVALGISLDGGRNAAGRRSRGRHLFRNMQEEYEARYGRGPAPPRAH